jgi:hypothetical protein
MDIKSPGPSRIELVHSIVARVLIHLALPGRARNDHDTISAIGSGATVDAASAAAAACVGRSIRAATSCRAASTAAAISSGPRRGARLIKSTTAAASIKNG